MPRKLSQKAFAPEVQSSLFNYDTTITPEVLEIQANVDMSGQDAEWLWTWTTSSLPYSRVNITTQLQTTVPLYAQGTYTINNFAAHELISGMSQTHALYLKWVEGAGTANNIDWVTYVPNVSKTHPAINNGNATQVTQLLFQVPSTITPPTLVAPNISYTVTNNGTGAYTFSGNAHGDNPTIGPFYRGGTYTFNVNATGHPFYLTEDNGSGFQAGQYVDEYTSGVTGSRTESGTLTIVVPNDAPDYLYYQCGNHAGMRGTIRVKDLAVTQNDNGNYVVYLQHSQDNHVTPVELRPLPSLVNQMCLVYDASRDKWVPQDLATYIDRTPSVKNKIKEVTGVISAAGGTTTTGTSGVKLHPYANYLPLVGNTEGDIAYASDTEGLYVWNGTTWKVASGQLTPEKLSNKPNASTGSFSLPVGTSAQRPTNPLNGEVRFNTSLNTVEVYVENTSSWQSIGDQTQYLDLEIMVLAGGGGGAGTPYGGGGGGAGGMLYYPVKTILKEPGLSYNVTVGAGGGGAATGANSTFGSGIAYGGGSGYAGNGGCGGGGGHTGVSGQYGTSIQTSNDGGTGYGYNGGTNVYGGSYPCGSGGGTGGAGGQMSNGGPGRTLSISGSSVTYGGGGGAADNNGNATAGGAGGGGSAHGGSGGQYTGGGGGGGKNSGSGPGGSGLVIVRYQGVQKATGGTITQVGGYTIHTFYSSGTFTIS